MEKTQHNDTLDFSGLFKLDVLHQIEVVSHSFYEIGLKKFLALSSDKELVFFYIDPTFQRLEKNYDWDFLDNPVYCMCFEPSGTWLIIVSDQKVLLVPFLPLFIPQKSFDQKWSLSGVSVLPLDIIPLPTAVVSWLTKESENLIIIASKNGTITFYSLESQSIVGECKVSGEIVDLQMCFDDSLDLLALLITSDKSQQWKLVLEHRSYAYNWLHQIRAQTEKDKRDGFMSYIKQSKDKITFLIQGTSKDDKSQTVEHVLKPTEYLPSFREGSNNWALTAQYVNGRHFLTAFEIIEGTMILEGPDEEGVLDVTSRTLRPRIKNDCLYTHGLWSQRLLYLIRKNEIEVHSCSFSAIQGDGLLAPKREFSELWSAEVIGDIRRAYLMSAREPPANAGGWKEPTFLCDLQLPRFSLAPCLIITDKGAYILTTVTDACEWVVSRISRGCGSAVQAAAALGAPVPALLRAASDLLLSRAHLPTAHHLYQLSQSPQYGWVARLGVFGRLQELSMYHPTNNAGSLGNAAIATKLLASLLKTGANQEEEFNMDLKIASLTPLELGELSAMAAAIGLWDLVPVFSVHQGYPQLLLLAIKFRSDICRGAIECLLQHDFLTPLLLEEHSQWLFDFIIEKCNKFDMDILKPLCLWLNPLQDQLRPVMRDLRQGITSLYTTRIQHLITAFIHVASAIESRDPCPEIHTQVTQESDSSKSQFTPRTALSCGLEHWALVDEGDARIMVADTPVNAELIGRVIDVACGRHHTLVLTENGLYAAGDNAFGQLGCAAFGAPTGGATSGALRRVGVTAVSAAAGHYHCAAIDHAGRLYTWGWGVHGQLGLGGIDDHCTPQLVTKLQGRKIVSVGCGACHTAVLTLNGEVWAFGNNVFGQLGNGTREKSSVPVRVTLPDPIEILAVGYFHNLALSSKHQVLCWGASPQQLRAATPCTRGAGRGPRAPGPPPAVDPHLLPAPVRIHNVRGRVYKLAAGWHHSCIVNNVGTLYTWGLNFDGQLGIGDRKQVFVPTEVKLAKEPIPESVKAATAKDMDTLELRTKALVACGGDFTVFIDDDRRVYITGNIHAQAQHEREKPNRIFMMKTVKRVIKIPSSRFSNKFVFQPIDRVDIMFPYDVNGSQRTPLEPNVNPLQTSDDFSKKTWADDVIQLLKPWITEENLSLSPNMAAKYAYHDKMYAKCLKLQLDNLKAVSQDYTMYLAHTELTSEQSKEAASKCSRKKDELKIIIMSTMSKRIKEVSLSILNEEPYPAINESVYKSLPCCCDELKYRPQDTSQKPTISSVEQTLAVKAASIIDKSIGIFPVDTELWAACFSLSKNFFLENNLTLAEFEGVLDKYMESNADTIAGAIIFSNECSQYSEILSPKFYLKMCSGVLDTWG